MIYFTISNQVSRISDGICGRIPPSEILAWKTLYNMQLTVDEVALLVEMDEAFCKAMNVELEERRPKPDEGSK